MHTILLIEDEEDLRVDIVEELSAVGYRTLEAGNGDDGLSQILAHRPDLVLCDISMPGRTGFEVLDALRTEHPECADIPFVFLTALADRAEVALGKRSGADDYLTKPIDFDDLLATLGARLRQVDRMRELKDQEIRQAEASFVSLLKESRDRSFHSAATALDELFFAVFLVSDEAEILYSNQAAKNLISGGDVLFQSGGKLRAVSKDGAAALAEAIRTAHDGIVSGSEDSIVTIRHRIDGHPLLAVVAALPRTRENSTPAGDPPVVAVFVTDPEHRHSPAVGALCSAYGLTGAERRVLEHLLEGERLSDVADMTGTSRNTVNTHLKSIFRKTGTSRQSELIAMAISSVGWR